MRKKVFLVSFIIAGILFIHKVALSHSMWISLENYRLKVGEETSYFIGFGHKYLSLKERVINLKENYWTRFKEMMFIDPDGEKVMLTPSKGTGKITVKKEGTYILAVKSERKADEPYGPSGKYAKAIIQVGEKDKGFSQVCGHRIEIIPLENPTKIKPGNFLTVKILFEEKPLSTFVYGTYSNFKPRKDAFPSMAKSNQEGIAKIKISHRGEWLIYVSHRVDYSAVLTFDIE
ncbi:DUF4198 domain-containing protein [Candidatus Aminicenantes bacterium AH-873-B07]|jgi:uncharacterized GH25 family protein|nr:DUF4198 domain-containing protein [Candidatus Aminicenantes bacterium AH-873-B07]